MHCIMREVQRVFWEDICHEVQNYNHLGAITSVHMAMKYALGPTPHLTIELKDLNSYTLFERSDQLKC